MPKKINDHLACKRSDEFQELLLDSRISPAQRALLDMHLAACPRCAEQFAAARDGAELLRAWVSPKPADDPGDGFNARVLQMIEAEGNYAAVTQRRVEWGWIVIAGFSALCAAASAFAPPELTQPLAQLTPTSTSLQYHAVSSLPWIQDEWRALAQGVMGVPAALEAYAGELRLPYWLIDLAAAAVLIDAWFIVQARRTRVGA